MHRTKSPPEWCTEPSHLVCFVHKIWSPIYIWWRLTDEAWWQFGCFFPQPSNHGKYYPWDCAVQVWEQRVVALRIKTWCIFCHKRIYQCAVYYLWSRRKQNGEAGNVCTALIMERKSSDTQARLYYVPRENTTLTSTVSQMSSAKRIMGLFSTTQLWIRWWMD